MYVYIYSVLIEHKQECLKSLHWTTTALHFICMFILPVRGPLFMDNWRTQIIIPLEWKNLLLLSAKFCNAFVYAHTAFWLPVYYYSVSAEPMGIWPIPKRCQAFSSLFLSVTSLCIPLKHTDPCLVCSLGGTHHTQQRLNTRCTHFQLCPFGRASRPFLVLSDGLPKSWHHSSWPVWWNADLLWLFIFRWNL